MEQRNVILLFLITTSLCADSLVVQTNNGLLRGKYMNIKSGKSIKAFLGVPYAEAPIGELRFKAPVPKLEWDGTKEATEIHTACPQIDRYLGSMALEGKEDCLFLNIYTPKNVEDEKLPVMVFIHGGAWCVGSGNTRFYGPDLLLDKGNVILVTINYRLGALGFLTTADDVVAGNMGLKDQTLALKWVKDNIGYFGGDSNSVTIFGESAGGASVHLQMMSPLTKGLFHAAISQSGTALGIWATQSAIDGFELTKRLATRLNCPTSSSQEIVDCLRNTDVVEILKNQMIYEWNTDPIVSFRPVIEHNHPEAFLSKSPIDVIQSGDMPEIPWITGVNTEEGAMKIPEIFASDEVADTYDNDFEKIAKYSVFVNKSVENYDKVINKIKKFYFNGQSIKQSPKSLINLFTDSWFVSAADASVNLMRKYVKAPLYYYLFGYKGSSSLLEMMGVKTEYGVCHGDDLQYLFTLTTFRTKPKEQTEADIKVTDIMTTLWTNFAKHKKPTPISAQLGHVDWKPVQSDGIEYFYIGDHIKMETKMFEERVKFWRTLNIIASNPKDEL